MLKISNTNFPGDNSIIVDGRAYVHDGMGEGKLVKCDGEPASQHDVSDGDDGHVVGSGVLERSTHRHTNRIRYFVRQSRTKTVITG